MSGVRIMPFKNNITVYTKNDLITWMKKICVNKPVDKKHLDWHILSCYDIAHFDTNVHAH